MTTSEVKLLSSQRKIRKKLVRLLFFLPMMALSGIGLLLIFLYVPWHLGEVWRDIGISLLIAGTVGLGVELSARREMERALGDLIEEKLAQATSDRFAALETALPRLDEIRDLVVRESGLQDAGVKRLSLHREDNLLQEFVERAAPGSTIRVMAICLNTLANHRGRDLFKRKLQEGCRIRLLLLDPDDSTALEERARQENRTSDEELREFKERVQTWGSVHKNAIQKLAADKTLTGSIELGYYQSLPSCFMIDNGHAMLVGFYLHGCRGEKCPHLEIENRQNGFYLQFDQHFETLWARRITPFDRRKKDEPVEVERRGLRLA
jgi:uncharacterized protein DUF5919